MLYIKPMKSLTLQIEQKEQNSITYKIPFTYRLLHPPRQKPTASPLFKGNMKHNDQRVVRLKFGGQTCAHCSGHWSVAAYRVDGHHIQGGLARSY